MKLMLPPILRRCTEITSSAVFWTGTRGRSTRSDEGSSCGRPSAAHPETYSVSLKVDHLQVERELASVRTGQRGTDRSRGTREQDVLVGHGTGAGECVELERHAVGGERRAVHEVEVQMRPGGVAGVAEQAKYLPAVHPVADLRGDAVGLQVGVEREVAAAEVDHEPVAAGVLRRREVGGSVRRGLLGLAVVSTYDGAVGDRPHVCAEVPETGQVLHRTDEQPAVRAELDEV